MIMSTWEEKDEFWYRVRFVYRTSRGGDDGPLVYLVGDFNGWCATEEHRMTHCEEGYHVTVLLSEGFYHYKFLVNGEHISDDWNPHKGAAYGNSVMFVHMDPAVYCVRPPAHQSCPVREYSSRVGSVMHTLCPLVPAHLSSRGLLQRMVFVYTPPSYSTHLDHTYPVLYAQDGQNLFSTPEGSGGLVAGGWYLDAKLDQWWAEGLLPEFILVAIPSVELACTGNRQREYSVVEYGSAREEPYIKYVVEVIKTAVDSNFRTKHSPQHCFTLGASLGGLAAFLLATAHPEVFSCAVCMSPAFWFIDRSNKSVYSTIRREALPSCRLYLDSGDGEGDNMIVTRFMADTLRDSGWECGTDYMYHLDKCRGRVPLGVTHSEYVWRARVLPALQFVFKMERTV